MSRLGAAVGLVVRAAVVAVPVGVVHWLLQRDVWSAILTGAIYGVGFTVLGLVSRPAKAMDGLTSRQRGQVMRTLRAGEAMDDADLAPALIEQARTMLASPLTPRTAGIGAAVFAVAGVVVGIVGYRAQGVPGLAAAAILLLFAALLVIPVWRMNERRRELIARSLRATEQRAAEPTGQVPLPGADRGATPAR